MSLIPSVHSTLPLKHPENVLASRLNSPQEKHLGGMCSSSYTLHQCLKTILLPTLQQSPEGAMQLMTMLCLDAGEEVFYRLRHGLRLLHLLWQPCRAVCAGTGGRHHCSAHVLILHCCPWYAPYSSGAYVSRA